MPDAPSDSGPNVPKYAFEASVTAPEAPPEVLAEIHYESEDSTTLRIRLTFLDEGIPKVHAYSHVMHLRENHCWLYSKNPQTPSVEVLGIVGYSTTSGPDHTISTIVLDASAVQIGILPDPLTAPTTLTAVVRFAPIGALRQPSFAFPIESGEIEWIVNEGMVRISLPSGSLEMIEDEARKLDLTQEQTATIFKSGVLLGTVPSPAGRSLLQTHESFCGELDLLCTILSLSYRRPVAYYEIGYWDPLDTLHSKPALYRQRLPRVPRVQPGHDELIHFLNMVNGGLDRLVAAFIGLEAERRRRVARGLTFLASSHSLGFLEPAYILAFAALECLVDAADPKKFLFASGRWERLRQRLREAVSLFLVEEGLKDRELRDTIDAVDEKVPEVRRPGIQRRVKKVCEELSVRVEDLWPQSVGFGDGLARATRQRNELVHAANFECRELHGDLVRIQMLIERIALKLLAWPDDEIWKWADQPLKFANRAEQ